MTKVINFETKLDWKINREQIKADGKDVQKIEEISKLNADKNNLQTQLENTKQKQNLAIFYKKLQSQLVAVSLTSNVIVDDTFTVVK